jgi:hypothetical protein
MTTQKFKGHVLKQSEVVNNICKVYNDAPDKDFNWYADANLFASQLADKHGCTWMQAAGIVAALSPQKSWDENKKLANDFLQTGKAGHTGTMIAKCKSILQVNDMESICEILNGPKITSFFINIHFPDQRQVVTIDRHAQDIAFGQVLDVSRSMTPLQYQFFINCYLIAGQRLNVPGYQVQAVTWVHWRNVK